MFVAEYVSRPPMAKIFYEDILMASFLWYPLLIENNKYGIVRYFEERGYDGYVLDRPDHLKSSSYSSNVKTKGIRQLTRCTPSSCSSCRRLYSSTCGYNEEGDMGRMYF